MQERKHYSEKGYSPFLFYVVFGVSGDQLQVSKSRHHVDAFPEKLEIHSLNRKEHADYIGNFFRGTLGMILKESDPELYEKCLETDSCVVIRGEIVQDKSLDYMRNVTGIIRAFLEQGAAGVLDLLTFSLYDPQKWTERFFEKEVNAQDHAVILVSEETDGYWLHTRGMLEFGRPDLSIRGVQEEQVKEYKEILDQMIFYGGEGVFFDGEFKLHTHSGNTYTVSGRFVNDHDNDDFNNAYCTVEVRQ